MPPKKRSKLQPTINSFFAASSQSVSEQSPEQNESVPEDTITPIRETEEPNTSRVITVEGRSYQTSWEKDFPWLEYDSSKDRAFCPICKWAVLHNKINMASLQPLIQDSVKVWTESGYGNWKKGKQGIKKHNSSGIHKDSMQHS